MTPRDLQLGSAKITPRHQERLAYIYVRQSSGGVNKGTQSFIGRVERS